MVVPTASAAAGASGGRPTCLVSNERSGAGSRSLQAGIDAAGAGDTLVVKGTCVGNSTIEKSLSLKGVSNKPFGSATLDGGGVGTVLAIGGAIGPGAPTVAVTNLVVANGLVGISNGATLTLTNSTVRDNADRGIYNENLEGLSVLTLSNSTVSGNRGGGIYNGFGQSLTGTNVTLTGNAATAGGGVFNRGVVRMSDSVVTGNTASAEGGGGVFNFAAATLTLTNSNVSANSATYGGGLFNFGSATLTGSTLSGNQATYGAGIFNLFSTLNLADSVVSRNSASSAGGGIYVQGPGSISLTGTSSVSDNSPDNCYPPGSVPGCAG